MEDPALETIGISHDYDTVSALSDVTLAVPPGALFGLLGPNGGGKTTLFRILSTLLRPTRGEARIMGFDSVTQAHAVRKRIGMVFQACALDGDLTPVENLKVQGALYGLNGGVLDERIDHLLDVFGLTDRRKDRVRTLSGGLQRRVDLARGLLHRPHVLLLDEPTTGLDPAARFGFWHILSGLQRDEGTTLVVATHLLEEAERCDRIAILDRGRVVCEGAPKELTATLGGETLWLETVAPETLGAHLHDRLGIKPRIIDSTVQLSHPDAHALLPDLFGAFGNDIKSATVRRPTLEDVFMVYAGYWLPESAPGEAHLPHAE